ncbi:hypothetical protein AALK14_09030 [Butyricimonas hominis]|uniref:hypothetical protein n=1 Tax=Butyricimonas TaxID=574697 RepID=UPI0035183DDA
MKIFRSPFRKTLTASEFRYFIIFFIIFMVPALLGGEFNSPAFWFLLVFIIVCLHLLIVQCFYVVLTPEKLIIKNGVYTFWKKEVFFDDIKKVKIVYAGKLSYPYMQIVTKKNKTGSWRYVINLINFQSYSALIEAIKAEGVAVETKGLTDYINLFKNVNKKVN